MECNLAFCYCRSYRQWNSSNSTFTYCRIFIEFTKGVVCLIITWVTTYSYWPWRFLSIALPNFFGNPGDGNYWGYASFWEDSLYFGIIPLLLTLGTIFKKNTVSSLVRFLWIWIIVGFLLALGKNSPVFPFFLSLCSFIYHVSGASPFF